MLHNTLSALLVSVASRYAQLSPSDVGIGIGGGRLVIDDVQLRADTFNGPHIPFHVQQGRAGRLRVNVPWSALRSSPVQVYLENVHLIAAPKKSHDAQRSSKSSTLDVSTAREHAHQAWHQTNVGRLLFNVSVEIYGLKVEYRDDDCIGVISVASLRAFSAGPDWKMRFVSLVADLDRDQPDATAVCMRKKVDLTGVYFVMIPRSKKPPASTSEDTPKHPTDVEEDKRPANSEGEPNDNSDHSQRNLDLESFESQSPILDGISISVHVLLCTGATVLPSQPDQLTAGLHGEVYVKVDEPTVKLTARQLIWIDHILKQGLGLSSNTRASLRTSTPRSETKRRPRQDSVSSDAGDSTHTNDAPADGVVISRHKTHTDNSPEAQTNLLPTSMPTQYDQSDTSQSDCDSVDAQPAGAKAVEDVLANGKSNASGRREEGRGGLFSVWEAIVGENYDETVDDAAIALGLWKDVDENGEDNARGEKSTVNSGQEGAEDADDDDVDSEDQQYARRAVQLAAECGGVTWEVRLRTTDVKAWDRVKELEKEVEDALKRASGTEEVSRLIEEARARVANAEGSTKEAERRAEELVERNTALANELKELEALTEGRGKEEEMFRLAEEARARVAVAENTAVEAERRSAQLEERNSALAKELKELEPLNEGRGKEEASQMIEEARARVAFAEQTAEQSVKRAEHLAERNLELVNEVKALESLTAGREKEERPQFADEASARVAAAERSATESARHAKQLEEQLEEPKSVFVRKLEELESHRRAKDQEEALLAEEAGVRAAPGEGSAESAERTAEQLAQKNSTLATELQELESLSGGRGELQIL